MSQTAIDSILVIDDTPGIRSLVARSLAHLSYRVTTADSVQTGLDALADIDRIRLLVVDFGLPDGTGLEVAKAARKLKPGIPILLMSGYDVEAADLEFIQKPFDPDDLFRRIEAMVAMQ